MRAINCWEILKCGREEGGVNAEKLGVCPAAVCSDCDGLNSGVKGGRICWAIAGTYCGGSVQGMFAEKIESCIKCEFFNMVIEEEGENFQMYPQADETETKPEAEPADPETTPASK